jgi:hypothetical protein
MKELITPRLINVPYRGTNFINSQNKRTVLNDGVAYTGRRLSKQKIPDGLYTCTVLISDLNHLVFCEINYVKFKM